jgi:serine/threonine kinase PknH
MTLITVSAVAVVFINTRHDGSHPNTAAGPANTPLPSTELAPPTTTPPPVAMGQLEQLLSSPTDIATEVGIAAMTMITGENTLGHYANTTSPPGCKPVVSVGDLYTYADSGWTDARGQALGSNDNNGRVVGQFVVLFPTASAASSFITASSATWQTCSNAKFTVTIAGNGQSHQWSTGLVSNAEGGLNAIVDEIIDSNFKCQRTLTAKNNVVIDVAACSGFPITNEAVNIAVQIAAKVPT